MELLAGTRERGAKFSLCGLPLSPCYCLEKNNGSAAGNPYRVVIRTRYVRCPVFIDNGLDMFCKERLGIGVSC